MHLTASFGQRERERERRERATVLSREREEEEEDCAFARMRETEKRNSDGALMMEKGMALEPLIKKEVPASVALAKAKKVLQMQKDLSEKLKKIPLMNRAPANSTSDGSPQLKLPAPAAASLKPPASTVAALPEITAIPNYEAVKCAQELAAKMGFCTEPDFPPLVNMFPGKMATDVAV